MLGFELQADRYITDVHRGRYSGSPVRQLFREDALSESWPMFGISKHQFTVGIGKTGQVRYNT